MFRHHRRLVLGAVVVAASSVLLSTSPAGAVTIPDWPSAGRMPVGCASLSVDAGPDPSGLSFLYTDAGTPTVTYAGLSTGTRFTVVGTTPKQVAWMVKTSEQCSGTIGVEVEGRRVGGPALSLGSFGATGGDAFTTTWTTSTLSVTSDDASAFTIPFVYTARRYDSFTLDGEFTLISKTDSTLSSAALLQGPWSNTPQYILRATTLTSAVSKTSVKKGAKVTATGVLTYAKPGAWAADNGEKVVVQVRVGSGAWVTKATLTASSTGKVSYTFAPTKTSSVRFLHAQVLSGRFTAAATSPVRTVKVA